MKRLFLICLPLLLLASLPAMATDFYWVGGSGNWSDIEHWRMGSSTGSIPLQAPSQNDNVYFDANSGFTDPADAAWTVTISGNVTCRDIKFDGCTVPPTFTIGYGIGSGVIFSIYGSSVWQAGMTLNGGGGSIIYQDTGTPKTITSNGVVFPPNTHTVINETSTVDLLDDWKAGGGSSSDMTINAGTFNTNDHSLNPYGFTANSATAKTLNLGNSDITTTVFQTNNASTTVNAGTSTIHLTVATGQLTGTTGQQFNNVISEVVAGGITVRGNITINRLEFKGNGILGNTNEKGNVVGDLILAAGKTYNFIDGSVLTVTGSITGGASCSWITFQTNNLNGTVHPALSVADGANVNLTGVILMGVNATGTAPVPLNGSVDGAGNATGWDFVGTPPSQNLYWVGGAGNWSDIAHWSFTSGGAGGDCVPGPGNNVFFDAGSGFTAASNATKTVTLDGTSYCKDITFAGAATPPILTGSQTLNIYGSSVWQAGMTIANAVNTINYQNTGEDKTITSNGVTTGANNLNIYETKSISLNDDFAGLGIFNLCAGTFNTNDHDITITTGYYPRIQTSATLLKPVTLNLGSSTITLAQVLLNNAYITINPGTSHIHVTTVQGFQAPGGQHFYNVTMEAGVMPVSAGSTAANPVYINELTVLKGANFTNYFNINTLNFAPGFVYTLADTRVGTQYVNGITVNESFTAGQDCAPLTVINGANNNTLSMPAGATVDVRNVMIQNSKATGGATFTANNSVDNNGNSGWSFTSAASSALYWVGGAGDWNDAAHWSLTSGGAGGACVPGMGSDVFFDVNSGFTDASAAAKTVTVAASANGYCRNVTVDGSPVPPIFTIGGSLNIYGSSVWQAGMIMNNTGTGGTINYQNTGTPKTITSNGVVTNSSNYYFTVNFNETTSISLMDDFSMKGTPNINAGTFNTGNHAFTEMSDRVLNVINSSVFNAGSSVIAVSAFNAGGSSTIHLGSSQWTIGNGNFTVNNGVTVTTEESTVTMTGANMTFQSYGQPFHNVVFNVPGTIKNNSTAQDQIFNSVVMKKGGTLNGNNTYGSLYLMGVSTGNAVYNLQELKTQTVTGELVMMGTTCGQVQLASSTTATTQTKAYLKVEGGTTSYNWVDMSDIDASSGSTIYLGTQGTSNRNENVDYDASGPIVFSPFPDWTCHGIVAGDADSYIIGSDGFYGNSYSKYEWRDSTATIIGTSDTLNILNRGYGTYTLTVTYYNAAGYNAADQICVNTSSIVVYKTPSLTDIYSDPTTPLIICREEEKTTVVKASASMHGQNVKWYRTDGTLMTDTDELVDGGLYQVTQTMELETTGIDCESLKVDMYVKLVNCNDVYVNPGGRMRVMKK